MTNLTLPIFNDPEKAREHLEAIRWPSGPVCPHCGVEGEATLLKGKSHRSGMYQCNACREPFSVLVGTVMERSHIPLNKWVLGFHLMASSKKGISAHQLHRMLGVTYKTAWFMAHRIREAMAPAKDEPRLGGAGKVVEADEMYMGKSHKTKTRGPRKSAQAILTLVERGGRVRSFPIEGAPNREKIRDVLHDHLNPKSTLHTDSAPFYDYTAAAQEHESVNHSRAYVRQGRKAKVHTNTAEGYISVFKRGMIGTYQHCEEQHLHRYLAEFDFRQSNRAALGVSDSERAGLVIKGADGKRLMYRAVSG